MVINFKMTVVKPVLNSHSKIDKTQILMTNGSLMKLENINLRVQEKCIWKYRLLKLSAANNSLALLTNIRIEANSVDQDQTAPIGVV